MRRSTLNLLSLAVAIFLLAGPIIPIAHGQKSPEKSPRRKPSITWSVPSSAQNVKWTVELQNNEARSTPEAAIDEVWNKARIEVAGLVRQYRPDLNWFPSVSFLKSKLRCGEPTVSAPKDVSAIAGEQKYLYKASLELELTSAAREEMLRMVRLEEAADRQLVLAKAMGAVLVLLIAVAGVLRISERSKNGAYKPYKSHMPPV